MAFRGAYPPYVPVAARRLRAQRELAQLAKKGGRQPAPVLLEGRTIAQSFWGRAWCENLERYSDFASRLPRGRSYVRNGSVVDLHIEAGRVVARVAGSDLYRVEVTIAALKPARWRAVKDRCTGKIASLVALLRGTLSDDVLEILAKERTGLFPEPDDIELSCSCPDWADLCKHVAAALYGVGVRLDASPDLLFTLRRVDQAELVSAAIAPPRTRAKSPAADGGKVIADDQLAALFGVDLEPAAPKTRRGKR